MNTFNSLTSPSYVLNEQIARQVFDVIGDDGIVMAIIDRESHCWPSDSERFQKLNISDTSLKELCARIDDGGEPIVSQVKGSSIIAAQLHTEHTNCGYVIIALPQHGPEMALSQMGLVEIVINQMNLIAKFIEKNNRLYELQMKLHGSMSQSANNTSN